MRSPGATVARYSQFAQRPATDTEEANLDLVREAYVRGDLDEAALEQSTAHVLRGGWVLPDGRPAELRYGRFLVPVEVVPTNFFDSWSESFAASRVDQ